MNIVKKNLAFKNINSLCGCPCLEISPYVMKAVIIMEDGKFWS